MDFIKSTNLVAFFLSFLYHKQAFILKEKSEIVLKRVVRSWPFVPWGPGGHSLNGALSGACAHEKQECGSGRLLIRPVTSDSSMLFSV